jgi:charged multivesicular body protein 3
VINIVVLKAGVMEEFVAETVDSALDTDDIEDEIEEEVDKVLSEVAGETIAQLPAAARKERVKPLSIAEQGQVRFILLFSYARKNASIRLIQVEMNSFC